MSEQYSGPPVNETKRDRKARTKGEKAYKKAQRPWYKKKRFLLPLILVLLIALSLAFSGGDEDGGTEGTTSQNDPPAVAADPTTEDAPTETEDAPAETEADPTTEPEPEPEPEPELTVSQSNAVRSAESYIDLSGFSRAGLIEQLSSEFGEGYPAEDAEAAVAYIEETGGVDWNEEAVQSAESYLESTGFSRDGLIEQLSSEFGDQFTQEQAEYAADQVGL